LFHKRFLWKIFFTYFLLISLSLIIFGIYATREIKDFYYTKITEGLLTKALVVRDELSGVHVDSVNSHLLDKYGRITDTRITFIDVSGKVLADSKENAQDMENHRDRPEFEEALKGNTGNAIRFSHTLQRELMYVAVPFYGSSGRVKAVLRTAVPIDDLDIPLSNMYLTLGAGGLVILFIITLISFLISRSITRPLTDIKNAAGRFSRGDFKRKIYPFKQGEMSELAESLNAMASQIDEKLSIIGEQKNIQQAVLESMKEGVLAVDYDEKILLINKTAEDILSIDGDSIGKTLQETVRVYEIQKFFKRLLNEGNPLESEVIIQHGSERTLQLSGTVLRDVSDSPIGGLIVLNDISSLKHLDNLKRDLVANVSHELKTPITTIKGFIEILKEGNIDKAEESQRFLEIVSKNTDRLNAIIEDLLSLSRLEQSAENNSLQFEEQKLKPILDTVLENYEFKAKEKGMMIKVQCEDGLTARINRPLIEQAIGNLLDNAIKYSDKNKDIHIYVIKDNGELIISVEDEGYGISSEHIPRLFERFYRVDKSRSRDEGGTGLGLAIVKHIAQVHGGTVSVESSPGKGSNFIIRIPCSRY
jgi:two-component system phosphate regulon sensor histidine kinase PhoR